MVAGAGLRRLRFANCSVALQHSFSLIRNVFQILTVHTKTMIIQSSDAFI